MRPHRLRITITKVVVGIFLVTASALQVARAEDDGVAKFIRSHPGYRGYVTPMPPYPYESRLDGFEGSLTVKVTFSAEGPVTEVELLKSSGDGIMDRHTIRFVKRTWRSTLGKPTVKIQTFDFRFKR